jgi:hypothetical protein
MTTTIAPFQDAAGWERALYAFLAEKERRSGSRRTVEGYSRTLQHFFGAIGKPPDRITSQEVFTWAYGKGLSGKEPSAVTIGSRLACLSSFYRFLIRMEIVSSNPCDQIERPKSSPSPPRGISAEGIRKLLSMIPETPTGLRDRAIILSWSVNPSEISTMFEENVPSIDDRLRAMQRAAEAGYPVRAIMMPIIPVEGWKDLYTAFTRRLLEMPIQRLALGGICIYRAARDLMERKMGKRNAISERLDSTSIAGDGRGRFPRAVRHEVYSIIIDAARRLRPRLEIALCLEEQALWESTRIASGIGRCNCGL